MIFDYKTIELRSEGEWKAKGSKFIAYISRIDSEEAMIEFLNEIKQLHFKARHHCTAFRLADSAETYRYNDDGEPSGTAGKPIFGQLLSADLYNVGVVVVRYFGGTKLGTSGLISAYKESTKIAIDNAKIVTAQRYAVYRINFDYEHMGGIMNVLKRLNLELGHKSFEHSCMVEILLPYASHEEELRNFKAELLEVSVEYIDDEKEVPFCQIEYEEIKDIISD